MDPRAIRIGSGEELNRFTIHLVGIGGLGVTCSPRDPRFAGSNPVEVDGFFQNVKLLREGL